MRLAALQETKRQSLAERQAELAQVRQAAAEITKSVADLSELIAKLDKEVPDRTGLGAYEKEIAAAAPARRRPGAGDGRAKAAPGMPPAPPHAHRGSQRIGRAGAQRRPRGHADARPHQAGHALRGCQGPAAAAGAGPPRADVRRENPVRQPIQGARAGDAPRRPGRVAVRRLDRLCGRVPQLWPALDHQRRRGLSYSACWTISDRRATRSVRACRRAGGRDEYGCEIARRARRRTMLRSCISSSARTSGP